MTKHKKTVHHLDPTPEGSSHSISESNESENEDTVI